MIKGSKSRVNARRETALTNLKQRDVKGINVKHGRPYTEKETKRNRREISILEEKINNYKTGVK